MKPTARRITRPTITSWFIGPPVVALLQWDAPQSATPPSVETLTRRRYSLPREGTAKSRTRDPYRVAAGASVIFIKMMRIYLSERGGNVQLSDVPSLAPLHHAHDRHKSLVTGVARNHKFLAPDHKSIHACCAKSSVDWDCVLVPEIFLTVQGCRRFLSRSSVAERWQCLRQ